MVSYNYTYNYNQKQPSFWQSLGMGMLYQGMGAFGSLTGCGMGMGGFGMGMGSCMGMGGSLFNMGGFGMGSYGMGMYGMGGYGMGCCGMSDGAFGAQLGLMGVGMIMQSVMGSIQERKADKAAVKTTDEQIKNVETEASTHLSKLKSGLKLKDYEKGSASSYYNTAAHNAKIKSEAVSQAGTLSSDISKLNEEIGKLADEISKLDKNSSNYNNDLQTKTALKTQKEQELTKKQTQQNNLNNIDPDSLTSEECTAEKFGETTAAALLKLVQAKEARKEEVDNAVEELDKLKDKYNELVEQKDDDENAAQQSQFLQQINDNDGNDYSRTSADKIQTKVKDKQDGKDITYDNNDIQGAIAGYRKSIEKGGAYKGLSTDKWKELCNKIYDDVKDRTDINQSLLKLLANAKDGKNSPVSL